MELIIQELDNSEEPKLCLNMIVKNESHIIKDTLNKLLQKVQFDYWVISDTGSTDNTKQVIIDFFKEKNIKGEIFDDEWLNFGHNRTKALEHAYGKSKYVLIFDADDEICGNFTLPELTKDGYFLQFGDVNGVSYVRLQIINNKKKWKYIGVLHEIISCCEPTNDTDTITGDYYTISGRTSYRNRDETKYLKDALTLEKAYNEAFNNNDEIYNRYGFYCANSYFDYGKYEEAIKWYKITLDNNNWSQEKYVACLKLFNCYKALNQVENGFFYLVKAFSYDKERVECLCELISHYCSNGMNDVAYGYYNIVKSFYNEKYLKYNLQNKLFLDVSKANFILPYYMILVADKMQDFDTITQMYKILFTKKHIEANKFLIGNFLYNLQFFIETVKNDAEFINLFKEYVNFLISINYPVYEHEFMVRYESYGILMPKVDNPTFSEEECLKSNKILFYTGYSPFEWNQTFSLTNALGGSETAAISLSKKFPKNYKIYIAGNVKEETVDNIEYVNLHNLKNLINTTAFHTIIVSRYLNFYEFYKNFSSHQTFIWGHDVILFPFDTNLSVENILTKWSSKINGCICQTEWHKNLFLSLYPQLKDKMHIINNGINVELFISKSKKINNRFLYTSCSERGLDRLLELWPSITENIPDSELFISSYNLFPSNEQEIKLKTIIDSYSNIKHLGKLNKPELYDLMSTAEYWLYPTSFNETSCITSMEMLLSEVICIYYPLAGLVNTLGDYGIPVERDAEIDTIMNLTNKRKNEIRKRGKEYAISCSWENRAKEWMKIMNNDNNINVEKPKSTILDMWKNFNVEPYYNFPVSKYWFGYSELKNYLLNNIDLTKQYNILEIGSFEGCSSCFLSDIVINNALSTLTCVDPFVSDGSIETDNSTLKYKFYSNIKKTQNYNKINVVEKFSDDFYSTYNGSKFNFIYIDGEHTEKQILKDLDECFSLLDINGIIWCDDYNNKWKHNFDDWILLKNDFINVIHSGYQIAFIKKKNEVKIKVEENRANEWNELPFLQNLSKIEKRMFDLYDSFSMPEAHIKMLKTISDSFTPNVIYDIGSNTLHWTREVKNIWTNAEIFAFDAIQEVEELYKSKNVKYNIGVLSDIDNKIVKFYENKENPAGNSYYKEIGHPNSVNIFPEDSYSEKIAMTLETIVKQNNFLLPDLVKIDVQGAELDILNGGMNIINNSKYLIIELQNVEYNRGAPLENITIDFLNKNGWEIVEAKFSNNGPDADYLFINKNYKISHNNVSSKDSWVFCPGTYMHTPVIQYIENLSDNSKKTIISNDINYINDINPHKIIFLLNPSSSELFERNSLNKFINTNFSFLQLEPLTLSCHLNHIISYFNKYSYLKQYPIYDYSKTNIRILNENGFTNCIHLPYNCQPSELEFLIHSNTNNKEYDFGYIYDWVQVNNGVKSFPIKPPRRNKITEFLINNGFTINLIAGYGEDRDSELGKCKIILNIHGQINENPNPSPDECSNIFEHIRCDRLLKAGYTILSETSYDLDQDFIDKYPNLKIIKYEDFFNLDVINNIIYELNIKNIYDKRELREYRYDTYNKNKVDSDYDIENLMLHYGQLSNTDKVTHHEYHKYYEPVLKPYYNSRGSIVEIGLGTTASLPMWKDIFKHAHIYGVDIEDTYFVNDRCTIYKADQSNVDDLKRLKHLLSDKNVFFINDDGSHIPEHQLLTFNTLFPILVEGGIYIIEDIETSYWTTGTCYNYETLYGYQNPNSIVEIFKHATDIINREFIADKTVLSNQILHYDYIESVTFARNCIIIKKNYNATREYRFKMFTPIQKQPTKKIVDCFIFYNELELLKYRLTILNDYVDYFVLVEATHTFVGKEKPLYYEENKELFKEFNHKIMHIVVDDFSHKYPNINIENREQWNNEVFQRNCIKQGLDKLKLNDEDIFTVTDLDEIPDPRILEKIKKNEINIEVVTIELDFYYYNLNCKMKNPWPLSKMISYKKYKELGFSCEQIRQSLFEIIPNAGWHLSYFGDEKFIKNKIENFAHQELNIEDFTNENKISNRVKNKLDLYDRPYSIVNVEIEDNDNLPPKYDVYLKKFYTNNIQNIK